MGKKKTDLGSIRHYMHLHSQLKSEMKKKQAMNRIRVADTAALAVIRTKHKRDELEAKRKRKKRKHPGPEESDEEELELLNDLD